MSNNTERTLNLARQINTEISPELGLWREFPADSYVSLYGGGTSRARTPTPASTETTSYGLRAKAVEAEERRPEHGTVRAIGKWSDEDKARSLRVAETLRLTQPYGGTLAGAEAIVNMGYAAVAKPPGRDQSEDRPAPKFMVAYVQKTAEYGYYAVLRADDRRSWDSHLSAEQAVALAVRREAEWAGRGRPVAEGERE